MTWQLGSGIVPIHGKKLNILGQVLLGGLVAGNPETRRDDPSKSRNKRIVVAATLWLLRRLE